MEDVGEERERERAPARSASNTVHPVVGAVLRQRAESWRRTEGQRRYSDIFNEVCSAGVTT